MKPDNYSLFDWQEDLLELVKNKKVWLEGAWWPLHVQFNGHKGVVFVQSEPLVAYREEQPVIACVTERTANTIAEEFNCFLPTQKIVDEMYKQGGVFIKPQLLSYGPEMMTFGYMRMHSELVFKELEKTEVQMDVGFQNTGKHWILTNRLLGDENLACNYGWFKVPYNNSGDVQNVWQTKGFCHNKDHVDYSQTLLLVHSHMIVNNQWVSLVDIGKNPEFAGLITYEGTVEYWGRKVDGEDNPEPKPEPEETEPAMPLTYRRLMYLTNPPVVGEDVKQWSLFLKSSGTASEDYQTTNTFDSKMHALTKDWQKGKKDPTTGQLIGVDGKVGPQTIRTANHYGTETRPEAEVETTGYQIDAFKQAKNWRWVSDRAVDYIVIHDAEMDELPTAAEALMNWAAGPNAPMASWHYAVDNNSITQSVKEEHIAWHAPGVNENSIGVEFAGRYKQTREQWLDDYGKAMLERGAWLFAQSMKRWDIPLKLIDVDGLLRGERGITTHVAVSKAFKRSTHIDPGKNFPMDYFFERIKSYL